MTRVEAWLDGQPLHSTEETQLLDVAETPVFSPEDTPHPGAFPRRTGLEITLTMVLRNPDPARRQAQLEEVRQWCKGRVLTLPYRPGQQLAVQCTLPPALGSTLQWTEPVLLGLAGLIPYWRSIHPVRHTFSAPAAVQEAVLTLPGNAPHAPLMMALTAAAPLQQLMIRCGADQMTLKGLAMSPGETLTLGTDDFGRFYLRKGSVSLLHCREMGSADALTLRHGKPIILQATGDAAFSGQVWAYGLYE